MLNLFTLSRGGGGTVGGSVTLSGVSGQGDISVSTDGTTTIITNANGPRLFIGTGSPNGVVAARTGSIYFDTVDQLPYYKTVGIDANGWV